ncbi:MAG: glucosamine-6-phosphate deaminase, partial [Stecheria intestinalis]|nr:glucosamine-6-phosphate deaminase [Stecheria intestinalis]
KDIITFNLDEYVGIPRDHEQSYYTFMHENLFNYIDCPEENIHVPEGNTDDHEKACVDYENALKQYVVDIQVLGIGSDGHIAFNEPGCPFDSETHLMDLTEQTRKDNARFFNNDINLVPKRAITMGLATIMRSRAIVLIATSEHKADAVFGMIRGEITEECPASILQKHPDVTVILDEGAASKL